MRNIRVHKVNIPSEVIEKSWKVFFNKYKGIEEKLLPPPKFSSSVFKNHLHISGSFQILSQEIAKLTSDELTSYFISDKTTRISIRLKTKVILRGVDYYIGIQPISNQERSRLIFIRLFEMFGLLRKAKLNSNIVLYLALLDYIRNYLLILLYSIHQISREVGDIEKIRKDYIVFTELIKEIELKYVTTISKNEVHLFINNKKYIQSLNNIKRFLNQSLIIVSLNKKLSLDIFRKIRECDNPAKIARFAEMIAECYLPRNALLIGLEYGGVELPFIVNAWRRSNGKNELDMITVNLSSYSTGSNKYIDSIEDAFPPFYSRKGFERHDTVVVLDDSITTGRTLEYLINFLPHNIKRVYFCGVSFTNTNRYHHLIRSGHGGVNPITLNNGIVVYRSNFTQTYSRKTYTNRKGVFDKEKSRIVKLLKSHYSDIVK